MELVQSSPSNATYNSANKKYNLTPNKIFKLIVGIYGLMSNGPSMKKWSG
jgi:hypothetical protein